MAHLGETVNVRIKQFRLMNGLNMQELAERAGVSRAVIVNIERNRKTDLTFSELVSIADALGVPFVALVYQVEKPAETVQVGRHETNVFTAVKSLVGQGDQIWEVHDTPATDFVADVLHATEKLDEAQRRVFSLASNLFFSVLRGTGIEDMVSVLLSSGYTHRSTEIQNLLAERVAEGDRANYALFLIEQIGIETQRWNEAASALRELGGEPGSFSDAPYVWWNTEFETNGIDQAAP